VASYNPIFLTEGEKEIIRRMHTHRYNQILKI